MPAGTNTTSCTSSLGRSEFLAKITAGRAEAGGIETKQSQEHGVSGLHDAIWGEMGMRVSLSSHLSTILTGSGPSEHPSQHVQTLRENANTILSPRIVQKQPMSWILAHRPQFCQALP